MVSRLIQTDINTAADYSRGRGVLRPHDLVWVAAGALDAEAPAWARRVIAAGEPVVVRRAPRETDRVPVGVRGRDRGQRYGTWIDSNAIRDHKTPETVALEAARSDFFRCAQSSIPAIRLLSDAAKLLDAQGWRWGVIGAVAYQLVSGRAVCRAASDLDLLVRAAWPLSRVNAAAFNNRLAALPTRCDVQIETPAGGVALAEWASAAREVLVKSDAGPYLTVDPWSKRETASRGNQNSRFA